MDRSDTYNKLIDALFEGKADADEAQRLLGDTSGGELEELAELAETLARIDPEIAPPSAAEFRAARQSVLASISASAAPARSSLARWLPLAAALAAFAVGLGVGTRNTAPAAAELTLTDLVSRSAQATDTGSAPGSNFRYSNLRLEEVDANTLALTVDVATELELRRPKDDLLVHDILASSLLNEESLGARLKAVRHAGDSPRIQRALMAAARNDPDMSVRLKALERLVERAPTSADTQATLLAVLENEESVVMRLMALDALTDDRLDASLLDSLDQTTPEEGDSAVLWHAQQLLNRRSL